MVLILMHQMHNSTTCVSSMMLWPKNVEILNIVQTVNSRKKQNSVMKWSQIRRRIELKYIRVIILRFESKYLYNIYLFGFPNFFRTDHHWRDLNSRNAHLVHQNWYCISLTLYNWIQFISIFLSKYRST
jgi:hypothetical protein